MNAPAATHAWRSVHVYYHDGLDGLDRLIDGAARPLVAELGARGLIDQHFFVRYWQGGPHLRLRVRPRAASEATNDANDPATDPANDPANDPATDATIDALIDAAFGDFLRAHPSRTVLRDDDYLAVARPLAGVEAGAEAVEPLAANNTVQHRAYVRELARYGGSLDAMRAAEQHFTTSSELAYEAIAAGHTRDQRTGQALSAMYVAAAVADLHPDGLSRFCRDARAEWGGQLFGASAAALEVRYQRQRARLRDLTRRLVALVAEGGGDAPITRWMRSIRRLAVRLDTLGVSPVLRNRILRQCSHMHCNRLGLSLPEEAYLRYLLWRATDPAGDAERPSLTERSS